MVRVFVSLGVSALLRAVANVFVRWVPEPLLLSR